MNHKNPHPLTLNLKPLNPKFQTLNHEALDLFQQRTSKAVEASLGRPLNPNPTVDDTNPALPYMGITVYSLLWVMQDFNINRRSRVFRYWALGFRVSGLKVEE